MDTAATPDDPRAERAARMGAARQRAAEAGDRAARLRDSQQRAESRERAARGSSAEDVADAKRLAAQAAEHLLQAFERGAAAHDRAARQHERQADDDAIRVPDPAGGDSPHHLQAAEHRRAAQADRDRAIAKRGERPGDEP